MYFDISDCYASLSEFEKAIDYIDKGMAYDDTFIGFYNNKGLYLYKMARFEEAREVLEDGVKLDPNQAALFYNLGLVYYKLDEFTKACQVFRRCEDLGADLSSDPYVYGLMEESCAR